MPKTSAPSKKETKKVSVPSSKKEEKTTMIKSHQSHAKDTGSPQVQIAILTQKINQLTDHLKSHHKDNHSRRGLLGMVSKRRKMLRYLQLHDVQKYTQVTKALHLRK
jgi:small subunit ribosomal protein S15